LNFENILSRIKEESLVQGTVRVVKMIAAKVKTMWVKGDIIVEGIKKTYYAINDLPLFRNSDINSLVQNWLTREILIAPDADDRSKEMFSNSQAQGAEQSKLDLVQLTASSSYPYLVSYGVDSTRGEIILSGSAKLQNGQAKVFFDVSFSSIISDKIPIKVLITPTSPIQGNLYVAEKSIYGFIVKGSGSEEGTFDWLVVARRRGFEGNDGKKIESFNSSAGLPLGSSSSSNSENSLITNSSFEELSSSSPPVLPEPLPTSGSFSEPASQSSGFTSSSSNNLPESSPTPASDSFSKIASQSSESTSSSSNGLTSQSSSESSSPASSSSE